MVQYINNDSYKIVFNSIVIEINILMLMALTKIDIKSIYLYFFFSLQPSRWALVCCLCKERIGACIQCSVKTCKTAFHVTCAFKNNLEMRTILESEEEGGVKLKVF